MNHIPPYSDSTRVPQHPPSDPLLLAELDQARTRIEILEQGLREIAEASDVPPAGRTWQERANHWRRIARATLTAAEGG
jgi:hypothetical protein